MVEGEIDLGVIDRISAEAIAGTDAVLVSSAVGSLDLLGFPVGRQDYDSVDLRRALSLAIDREALLAPDAYSTTVAQAARLAAMSFTVPDGPGGRMDSCDACAFDPDLAGELYRSSGGVRDDRLTLHHTTGGDDEIWLQLIADDWEEVLGIEVELEEWEFPAYLEALAAGRIDGPFRIGWEWRVPSASDLLLPLFESDGGDNRTGFVSPAVDYAGIVLSNAPASSETGSLGAVHAAEAEIEKLIARDMPAAPLFFDQAIAAHRPDIDGVELNSLGVIPLERVEPPAG